MTKPIIVIKPGRTEEASQAAVAHTGSLTGSDDVLDAAFRRCGVLRVDRIDELFSMAEILNTQPRLKGPRLTILTNAGGPGVLATDTLIAGGGQLAPLASESIEALNRILPRPWSHRNPIDLLGDASLFGASPLCPRSAETGVVPLPSSRLTALDFQRYIYPDQIMSVTISYFFIFL